MKFICLIELFALLEMDPQKLSTVAICKTAAAAKKQLILGSYLDIHPGWKGFIEKRESRTAGNINPLKKTSENGAQRSTGIWALYDKIVLPDKSKRETNSEEPGNATEGTQDGMSSDDHSDTSSLWSISSLETSEAQSNKDKPDCGKDDHSDTSSLWSISSLETSEAQSNKDKPDAGKDDHSDTSSLWSISSLEASEAQSNKDKPDAGKDDHSDTSSLWSISSLEASEAQSNKDKPDCGKDDHSDTSSLWSISSLEASEAQSNKDKPDCGKDDHSDTSSLWSISSLEASEAQSNKDKPDAGKDDHSDTSSLWSISSLETSEAQSNKNKPDCGKDDHSDTSSLWSISSLETSEAQSNKDKPDCGKDDHSDTSSLWSISSLETSEAQSNKDKPDCGKDDHSDTSSLWSISSLETSADSSSLELFEAEGERAKVQGRERQSMEGNDVVQSAPSSTGRSNTRDKEGRDTSGVPKRAKAGGEKLDALMAGKGATIKNGRRGKPNRAKSADQVAQSGTTANNTHSMAMVRCSLEPGWERFSYNTSHGRSAPRTAPGRNGPSHAPDRQRRTDRNLREGKEKHLTVTLHQGGLIDPHKAASRASTRRSPAREAAAEDEISPRVEEVKRNHNAPAQARGRVRRGWVRFSVATRRLFRRCLPRCCARSSAD